MEFADLIGKYAVVISIGFAILVWGVGVSVWVLLVIFLKAWRNRERGEE